MGAFLFMNRGGYNRMGGNNGIDWIELFALVTAIAAFVLSWKQYAYEKDRNRKEATIHAFDKLEEEVFFNKEYRDDYSACWIYAPAEVFKGDKNGANRKLASQILSRVEHFAVGINSEIYDLETLNRMAGSFIIDQYQKNWQLYISTKRQKDGNNNLYIEIEQMVKVLNKLRESSDKSEIDSSIGTQSPN